MDLSQQQKRQIIENRLQGLKQEEFDLQIQKDVYKECGMDERLEQVAENLTNNRKMQSAYETQLENLEYEPS
jgi:hypothetical protein